MYMQLGDNGGQGAQVSDNGTAQSPGSSGFGGFVRSLLPIAIPVVLFVFIAGGSAMARGKR